MPDIPIRIVFVKDSFSLRFPYLSTRFQRGEYLSALGVFNAHILIRGDHQLVFSIEALPLPGGIDSIWNALYHMYDPNAFNPMDGTDDQPCLQFVQGELIAEQIGVTRRILYEEMSDIFCLATDSRRRGDSIEALQQSVIAKAERPNCLLSRILSTLP